MTTPIDYGDKQDNIWKVVWVILAVVGIWFVVNRIGSTGHELAESQRDNQSALTSFTTNMMGQLVKVVDNQGEIIKAIANRAINVTVTNQVTLDASQIQITVTNLVLSTNYWVSTNVVGVVVTNVAIVTNQVLSTSTTSSSPSSSGKGFEPLKEKVWETTPAPVTAPPPPPVPVVSSAPVASSLPVLPVAIPTDSTTDRMVPVTPEGGIQTYHRELGQNWPYGYAVYPGLIHGQPALFKVPQSGAILTGVAKPPYRREIAGGFTQWRVCSVWKLIDGNKVTVTEDLTLHPFEGPMWRVPGVPPREPSAPKQPAVRPQTSSSGTVPVFQK